MNYRSAWISIGIFVLILVIQIGYLIRLTEAFGIKFKPYHILTPIVLIIGFLWFVINEVPYRAYKTEVVYLSIQAFLVLSILATEATRGQFDETFKQVLALGYVFGLSMLIWGYPFERVAKFIVISGFPVLLLDLGAIVGLYPFVTTASPVFPMTSSGGLGVNGLFGEHGIVVSLTAVSSTYLLKHSTTDRKPKYLLSIMLSILVVYFSQSRSSIIALLAALAVIGLFWIPKRRIRYFVTVSLLVIIIPATMFLIELRPDTFVSRINQLSLAYHLFMDQPLVGIGWDIFFPKYSDQGLHFTPFRYFLASGLIAGVVFLVLLIYPLILLARSILSLPRDESWILISILAMYLAIIIEIALYPSTPEIPLLAVGLLACYYSSNKAPAFVERVDQI